MDKQHKFLKLSKDALGGSYVSKVGNEALPACETGDLCNCSGPGKNSGPSNN